MTQLRPMEPSLNFAAEDPQRIDRLNRVYRVIASLQHVDREQERYGAAAEDAEPCLCTPVDYGGVDLSHIPTRVLEVDYGCGDPTRFAEAGETVLDLGSGSGKHCFMMARKVGPNGRVIGIDKTPQMLELSRGAIGEVMSNLGYGHPMTSFRRGNIENLRWDLDRLEQCLAEGAPNSYADLERIESILEQKPLVTSDSVDLVVSNCVLNLVEDHDKGQLFAELYRVLKKGGRAIISDIVAARDVPDEMKEDAALWTGCVSGALRRDLFLQAFLDAGFYGVQEISSFFWREEGGIPFYSVTVAAFKGKEGPCYETYRNAFYQGPFSAVADDDGHTYPRGVAVPVCEKTANILSRAPYTGQFVISDPLASEAQRIPFDCSGNGARSAVPADIAQRMERFTGLASNNSCDPASGCC